MAEGQQEEIRLADYTAPAYLADTIELDFELDDTTAVASRIKYVRQRDGEDLVLNGEAKPANMVLKRVCVDGKDLGESDYKLTPLNLTIPAAHLQAESLVEIDVTIEPAKNTALAGLYKSSGNFCTQCEAEGARNFMYLVDRPDNMSRYTTKVVANKEKYPYLLSNGNDVERGDLEGGRHFVKWVDPWPKPSYLFALVAGDFAVDEGDFKTCSGKDVKIRIFVERGNEHKTAHAMQSIKRAFKWDEERFDREYDLEQFNIVAVSDFNMGAMENKSLNVFNSRAVLCDRNTSTDADFERIEGIIGHEYFHNWSGNRVTCRDWFQLTLKEGLTVFRDQEFTSDLNSRVAKRISDVHLLRMAQYPEDASPISHPIRPPSYVEINNFYTATVYEKGAEVIRMINTIVGVAGFKKGLNLYFERHDGQAVTCDDFVKAMEDANGVDLTQFRETWYSQSGTPVLNVSTTYDADAKTFSLHIKQSCPPTAGQASKQPFDIPVAVGLIGAESHKPLPVKLAAGEEGADTVVLRLTEAEQTFVLHEVNEKPVPSLMRGFSAPVKLHCADLKLADLAFLAAHDTDEFVRYDSLQELAMQILQGGATEGIDLLVSSLRNVLKTEGGDKMVLALSLTLPDAHAIADSCETGQADVDAIASAVNKVNTAIATELEEVLVETYNANNVVPENESDGDAAARRALKNACLNALASHPEPAKARELAVAQFEGATNMTDRFYAVLAVRDLDCPERKQLLDKFFELFKHDRLVMNKWFTLHARSDVSDCLASVKDIMGREGVFEITNPNNVYSLVAQFAKNFSVFHDKSGESYKFVVDQIIRLDKINPQVASRVAKTLTNWRLFATPWSSGIKAELERLAAEKDLSPDVYEIVTKSLAPPSSSL